MEAIQTELDNRWNKHFLIIVEPFCHMHMQVRKLPEEDREYMRSDKIARLGPSERRDEVGCIQYPHL